MERSVIRALEEHGPLSGCVLRDTLQADDFGLWKACMRSDRIQVTRVGRRYLRLDRKVGGYARLSPSILREFLTYSVVSLTEDSASLRVGTAELADHIAKVNATKLKIVQRIVGKIGSRVRLTDRTAEEHYCILLGGDVVYGMAHDAPRTEHSTGLMVRGSDLDLVIITADDAPEEVARQLDETIHQEKHRQLSNPASREEIDYVVKPLSRVREQAAFDTFRHMVACKILQEAILVFGNAQLHESATALLTEEGIPERLVELEAKAVEARKRAEDRLLARDEDSLVGEDKYLFHTSEETEEFE